MAPNSEQVLRLGLEHEGLPHRSSPAPGAADFRALDDGPDLDPRPFGGEPEDLLVHLQATLAPALRPPDNAVASQSHVRYGAVDQDPVGEQWELSSPGLIHFAAQEVVAVFHLGLYRGHLVAVDRSGSIK